MSLFNDLTQHEALEKGAITQFAQRRFRDLVENPTRLGEQILPWVSVEDYTVATGRVEFRGIANAIIAMDSPLPRGPLGTLSEREFALLKTGLKYSMIESELKHMRDLLALRRLAPEDFARLRPYQLANALVTAYADRAEAMRWQALANDSIPLRSGVSVAYGVPAAHKATLSGTDRWSEAATADGLADLLDWDGQVYDETGGHVQAWVMSRAEFNYLIEQTATRNKIQGFSGSTADQINAANGTPTPGQRITIGAVNAYLAAQEVGPIVLYDRKYNEYDTKGGSQPVATRFLPENKVVGVAPRPVDGGISIDVPGSTALGYCADGPVAENDFQPGLHVWFQAQMEPLEVSVLSVGWALPVIVNPNTLFQAQTY